jgi:hypothetical protein
MGKRGVSGGRSAGASSGSAIAFLFHHYTKENGDIYFFIPNALGWGSVNLKLFNHNANPDTATPVVSTTVSASGLDYIEPTFFGLTPGNFYDLYAYPSGTTDRYAMKNCLSAKTLNPPTTLAANLASKRLTANHASGQTEKIIFQIENLDTTSSYAYTRAERQYFYDICLRDNEEYSQRRYFGDVVLLTRWTKSNVTFKCNFQPSVSSATHSFYESAVEDVLDEINAIIGSSGVSTSLITSGTPDVEISIGNHLENWGYVPPEDGSGQYFNGEWFHSDSSGVITSGTVKINTTVISQSLSSLLREELAQVMGAGNDWITYKDSAFFIGQHMSKASTGYPSYDQAVLKLLYTEGLPVGSSNQAIAKMVNVTIDVTAINDVSPSAFAPISAFLTNEESYQYRAFEVANGFTGADYFSSYTSWNSFTLSAAETGVPSSPVDFTSRLEGGFALIWGSATNSIIYNVESKPAYLSDWTSRTSVPTTYNLTGLSYGVTYDFRVQSLNTDGEGIVWSDYTEVTSWTTAPKTPSISVGTVDSDSITINVSGMSGNYDDVRIDLFNSDSEYITTQFVYPGGESSTTFTELTPGETYHFLARSKFFINSIDLFSVSDASASATAAQPRPTDFSWTYSTISSGSDAVVDHRDWNALAGKIDEFRVYKGKSEYGFSTVTAGGSIYAWQFNQLVNSLINDGGGGTQMTSYMTNNVMPSEKNSGDDFAAAYLLNIVTSLNSIT